MMTMYTSKIPDYYVTISILLMSSTTTVLPEGTTEIFYPRSKRKIVKDSKGNIISDSAATIKDS